MIFQVIGWNYMNLYSLRVNTEGYTTDYDATCNPGIFNEFSTAAFRFGHSLIRPMLTRVSSSFKEMDSHIRLRDGFFNPDMLYESKMIDEVQKKNIFTTCKICASFLKNLEHVHIHHEKKRLSFVFFTNRVQGTIANNDKLL